MPPADVISLFVIAIVGVAVLASFFLLAKAKGRTVERLFAPSWPTEAGVVLRQSKWGQADLQGHAHVPVRLIHCTHGFVVQLMPLGWQGSGREGFLLLSATELVIVQYPGRLRRCLGMFTPRTQLFVYGRLARFVA